MQFILFCFLVILLIYIFYFIYIEFKARLYLNIKNRILELESKQKK